MLYKTIQQVWLGTVQPIKPTGSQLKSSEQQRQAH